MNEAADERRAVRSRHDAVTCNSYLDGLFVRWATLRLR